MRANRGKILIIGAGYSGGRVAAEWQRGRGSETRQAELIGFVDDDPRKQGRSVEGLPVLGTSGDLPELVASRHIRQVWIAIPSATVATMRRLIDLCNEAQVDYVTLPTLTEIDYSTRFAGQARRVSYEDLLQREPVELHNDWIEGIIRGQTILVTGAGGSIGSELCRQILRYRPRRLVLLDHSEFQLFHLHQELTAYIESRRQNESDFAVDLVLEIADIRFVRRIEQVFARRQPNLVLHAAAYKHVPMMEEHPLEALQNNVLGTYNVVNSAFDLNLSKVIIISTDKAVNPTNVMGASKRLSEIVSRSVRTKWADRRTKLTIVRFGNVLGSNGSVIPLFQEQIQKGGPVTVTHPDVTRFFMSIPEASQLVLEASTMGSGDEVFVLDMGEPVKILELAREMIVLNGYIPDKDIPIKVTGLRPGEKLYEEILTESENIVKTHHPKILIAKLEERDALVGERIIKDIQRFSMDSDVATIQAFLKQYVPEYNGPEAYHKENQYTTS